jgi:hypothetical protein
MVLRMAASVCFASSLLACGGPTNVATDDAGSGTDASAAPSPRDAGPTPARDGGSPRDAAPDADAGPPACDDPPADPGASAVCVTIEPETIAFLDDPSFDGRGRLYVQAFPPGEPRPEIDPGGEILSPPLEPAPNLDADAGAGTADAGALDAGDAIADRIDLRRPIARVRIDHLTGLGIFVRALFTDHPTRRWPAQLSPGWWLGGFDLTRGFVAWPDLTGVTLEPGKTTSITLRLTPVRRLRVRVDRAPAVPPSGDGQEPVGWSAYDTRDLEASFEHVFGQGGASCGDVSGTRAVTTEGSLIGTGPYWLNAWLADFGQGPLATIPGGMLSRALDDLAHLPESNRVDVPPTAYSIDAQVQLNKAYAAPEDGDDAHCP